MSSNVELPGHEHESADIMHSGLMSNGIPREPMRYSASSSHVTGTTHCMGHGGRVVPRVVVVSSGVVVGSGSQWQQVSPSSTNFMFL